MENQRQHIELAEIFRDQAKTFPATRRLCPEQQKAYTAIMECRTATLGGHTDRCEACGYTRQSYNSCRNRHCPKCQLIKTAQWVDKVASNLPPVPHFHIVFTIPSCLYQLFYINQQVAYGLLFKAAGKALLQCASQSKYLGVQAGAVALLHTWGQTLVYHPHIHMMVPSGGLSEDMTEWIASGKKFYVPVKVLSCVFRGILCRLLEQAVTAGEIRLPEKLETFKPIKEACYKKKWVVYCEKPFSKHKNLIQYLGHYSHRVALSNNRLLAYKENKVTFSYKDNQAGGLSKRITLEADEFIRRFLQHVLPCGFYKVRYFGFMALCNMKAKLSACFELIGKTTFLPVLEGITAREVWRELTGHDPYMCPKCKTGRLKSVMLVASGIKM
jgi:predicted Zn-ribbon and HTH transcriptional regulator